MSNKETVREIKLKEGPLKEYLQRMLSSRVQDSMIFTTKLLNDEMKKFHEEK